jgi:hypothetical protein
MTDTAKALTKMLTIADQIEDLEVSIDYVRRTSGDSAHVAKLQQLMSESFAQLESAWDAWNAAVHKERMAIIHN